MSVSDREHPFGPRVVVTAQAVVGQGLDDAAVCGRAPAARRDHALKLAAQGLEPGDLAFHRPELLFSQGIGVLAWEVGMIGKFEKPADGVDGKAQLPRMLDKGPSAGCPPRRTPAGRCQCDRRGQQADLLVEADGWNLDARPWRACRSSGS